MRWQMPHISIYAKWNRARWILLAALAACLVQPGFAAGAGGARQLTLGDATAPLGGLWKFHTGDNPQWASPNFDDSAWGTMDLTPPRGSYDPQMGTSGFVPGWTARGYPGYHGFAWYRLRVDVQGDSERLALKMPDDFDDAYQVYVNGRLIGEFGRFDGKAVTPYSAQPRAFELPAGFHAGPATIAIRMYMTAFTPLVNEDAGGLHGPPVLGQASAIEPLERLDENTFHKALLSDWCEAAIVLLGMLVGFTLYWLDRGEPGYLWLGLTCAALLASFLLFLIVDLTTWIGGVEAFLARDAVIFPLIVGLWVIFWGSWFRLEGMRRLHSMVWLLTALLIATTAMLRAPLYGGLIPAHAAAWLSPLNLGLKLLLGLLLVWVTVRGIRQNRMEGWMALPAVVLVAISMYAEELLVLHVPVYYFPFGYQVNVREIGTVLSLAIITVLLLRRFVHGQREREQWKSEIEQARQVQQVLIPEALPRVPGFTMESEYRPARQVGGDFFQILPDPEGGVLIVVGDVTGKGLRAGMMVALITGAIRTIAETTMEPLEVLQTLNRRLCGRDQAQATCLALHIGASGQAILANAGHLAPYRNGVEVRLEGSLPLGMEEAAEFEEQRFALEPGDRLTLLSDGVVEAVNPRRELFGFDRAQQMSQQPAAAIVQAAQAFGQEDDITVLSVRFAGARDAVVA